MALERISSSLDYISMLPDRPNDMGGLSAAELKACFDRAGQELKDYVNNILLPALEGPRAASELGISPAPGLSGAKSVQQALEKIIAQMKGITLGSLAEGSVDESRLAPGAVTGEKLADGAVIQGKLGPGAVEGANLAPQAVSAEKIAPGAVGEAQLAENSVGWGKLKKGAVGTEAIDALAVTGEKLAPGAVSTGKIAPGAVKGAALARAGAELGGVRAESALAGDSLSVRIREDGQLVCPGLSLEKLWENPAPAEGFAPRRLELELGPYPLVAISWKRLKSAQTTADSTLSFKGDSSLYQSYSGNVTSTGSRDLVLRPFSVEERGIDFGAASLLMGTGSSLNTDNNLAIPVMILGIRGTAADRSGA